MRNVPIFGILALPILSTWLSRAFHPIEKLKQNTNDCTKKVMPLKIILSSALVLILVVYSGQIADTAIQKTYPVSAMKWLKEHPTEGNIFNPYEWGGYLIYYYPEQKVFIDSRMAPYIPEVANDYEAIKIQLPGWQDLFAKYEMKTALIQASDQSLVVALESMENWQRVYRDPVAEIFVISENR
jgi:hypothetical protein